MLFVVGTVVCCSDLLSPPTPQTPTLPPNFQDQNTNSSIFQLFQGFPAKLITEALPKSCLPQKKPSLPLRASP